MTRLPGAQRADPALPGVQARRGAVHEDQRRGIVARAFVAVVHELALDVHEVGRRRRPAGDEALDAAIGRVRQRDGERGEHQQDAERCAGGRKASWWPSVGGFELLRLAWSPGAFRPRRRFGDLGREAGVSASRSSKTKHSPAPVGAADVRRSSRGCRHRAGARRSAALAQNSAAFSQRMPPVQKLTTVLPSSSARCGATASGNCVNSLDAPVERAVERAVSRPRRRCGCRAARARGPASSRPCASQRASVAGATAGARPCCGRIVGWSMRMISRLTLTSIRRTAARRDQLSFVVSAAKRASAAARRRTRAAASARRRGTG